jgi:murein DD-endopeptidase MepM/ murein hydrolase activator NlpD
LEALLAALGNWLKSVAISWLRRHWKKIVVAVVGVHAFGALMLGSLTALLVQNDDSAQAANVCRELGYSVDPAVYTPSPVETAPSIPTGGEVPGFGPNDGAKIENARTIIAEGAAAGVGKRGMIVAIATAIQESQLENLDYGDRDSLGLFQQRPSQGWGTPEQVRDPSFSARAFYGGPRSPHYNAATGKASPGGLLEVGGWESMPITVAAQRVQRSGFPDAYAKHEARATTIVDALAGSAPTTPTTPTTPVTEPGTSTGGTQFKTAADFRNAGVDIDEFCGANFELVAGGDPATNPGTPIAEGEWTAPLQARVTSEFGMRLHPVLGIWRLHAGTDFSASTGTPLVAASNGVVKKVTWWGGGGLIVVITHANDVETWYLHLSQALVKPGDTVQGGQTIALSGATGVGTGPHFHFETHVGGKAVEPVAFMAQRGVNLRAWS